jgi:hypothetical protein
VRIFPSSAVHPTVVFRLIAATLIAAAGAAFAPGHAWSATPAEQAEALVRQGNQLRSAGDDQSALPIFQKAVDIYPSPRTWAQLGLVEKALGRWADADQHLTDALKGGQDPWIQKNVRILEQTLAEAKRQVARIEITGEPAGAEVLVNGRPVGKVPLPQPIRVNAGTVDIEMRAAGYRPTLRTVSVTGLQYQPVVIRLEREGAASPGATESPPGAVSPLAIGAGPGAEGAAQPWRPWAIGGTAAGGAIGLGLGILGVVQHDQKVTDFNKRMCQEGPGGTVVLRSTGLKDRTCSSLYADYKNARTLAIVGFAAGAALGATSLILYLTTPSSGSGSETALSAPLCTAGPGDLGIGCTLRF